MLYHRSQGLHHHSKVHRHALSTTIRCPHTGGKSRLLSAHLPHHASLELTAVLLSDWGHGIPKGRVWLGIDAKETFTPALSGPPLARTARGEEILHSFLEWGLVFPPQQLTVPGFHPYNLAMMPRRIDYVLSRGSVGGMTGGVHPCRHQASSDHDVVLVRRAGRQAPTQETRQPMGTASPERGLCNADFHQYTPPSGDPPLADSGDGQLHRQGRRGTRSLPRKQPAPSPA